MNHYTYIEGSNSLKQEGTLQEPNPKDYVYKTGLGVHLEFKQHRDDLAAYEAEQQTLPEYIVVGKHSWKDGERVPETAFVIKKQLLIGFSIPYRVVAIPIDQQTKNK